MTVKDVALQLQVKERVVYDLCARRLLGHHRIGVGRGVIRIGPEDVAAYLASVRVEARPPAPRERPAGTRLEVRDIMAEMAAEKARRADESERRRRANGRP